MDFEFHLHDEHEHDRLALGRPTNDHLKLKDKQQFGITGVMMTHPEVIPEVDVDDPRYPFVQDARGVSEPTPSDPDPNGKEAKLTPDLKKDAALKGNFYMIKWEGFNPIQPGPHFKVFP